MHSYLQVSVQHNLFGDPFVIKIGRNKDLGSLKQRIKVGLRKFPVSEAWQHRLPTHPPLPFHFLELLVFLECSWSSLS